MKEYELVDITEPELFNRTFPHNLPPFFDFEKPVKESIDGREVEYDPASVLHRDIHLTDTTFRDGQQARPPYTTEQTVRIFEMLSRLGGKRGVVRQSEFFLYTKRDLKNVEACRNLGLDYPAITGWIRAQPGELRKVRDMQLKETGILTSCSDYHIFLKQAQTRREAMDRYLSVAGSALEAGIRPRCHLEDITRADIKGFVLPFVQALEKMSAGVPAGMKVKIRLCDTMGFGLPYPNVSEPRSIPKLIWRIREECGIEGNRLEWHGHNDFHRVHANGICAWLCGADALNTTLFGFGERTGNPPLEGALVEYVSLKRDLNGVNLPVITELARYYENTIGSPPPVNYPFTGRDFNTTRAGIHAGGLRKNERIYTVFDTNRLLNLPPKVSITDKSGTDGIALWVNEFLGLRGKNRVSRSRVAPIQRWVMNQYEKEGRNTAISEEELEEQVRINIPLVYAERVKSQAEDPGISSRP